MSRTPVTLEALRAYFPDGRFGRRVWALPEYGCIYVKNAKAGSSTVALWLHRIHSRDHTWEPDRNIHTENALPTAGDVGLKVVAEMLSGAAFRFSFVRDPVARAESAYLDKIADMERRPRWRLEVQRIVGLPEDPDAMPSFEQFVTALESQEPIRMDPHWRPQHLNLMHGLVEYDLVGRLESFRADLDRVREAVGIPEIPMQVRNARPRTDSLFAGRPDLLGRVRDVYARDLELYGYS